MRQHDLKDISGQDVFLGLLHRLAIGFLAHIGGRLKGFLTVRRARRQRDWPRQRVLHAIDGSYCGVVPGFDVLAIVLHADVRDQVHFVLHVVEDDQAREEHEDRIGRVDVPLAELRDPVFDEPHQVVADVADGAGTERR